LTRTLNEFTTSTRRSSLATFAFTRSTGTGVSACAPVCSAVHTQVHFAFHKFSQVVATEACVPFPQGRAINQSINQTNKQCLTCAQKLQQEASMCNDLKEYREKQRCTYSPRGSCLASMRLPRGRCLTAFALPVLCLGQLAAIHHWKKTKRLRLRFVYCV